MSKATELDVAYVAQLARLQLTAEETRLFQKQLGEILRHARKLEEVDITGVEPASHALPVGNVFREDEAGECLSAEEALGNAPRRRDHLFIVTKVVE